MEKISQQESKRHTDYFLPNRTIFSGMVAHKCQPSSKDRAHHADTTTTPHYFSPGVTPMHLEK